MKNTPVDQQNCIHKELLVELLQVLRQGDSNK